MTLKEIVSFFKDKLVVKNNKIKCTNTCQESGFSCVNSMKMYIDTILNSSHRKIREYMKLTFTHIIISVCYNLCTHENIGKILQLLIIHTILEKSWKWEKPHLSLT